MTHPTISREQAVQLAREAGLSEFIGNDRAELGPQLQALAKAAFKLGRNQALEEAKDKVRIHTLGQPLVLAEKLTSAIESLKDNTP